ncbi:MAG TPA: hypothetical protein VMS74_07585 [Acidimicrobiia bacterium]|nr:hypothetical protein [Acidimicrobiia bacterium]
MIATIMLSQDPPYEPLEDLGSRLMKGLTSLASDHGIALNVQGLPIAFHAGFGAGPVRSYGELRRLDASRYVEFSRVLISQGVWVAGRGIWYLSTAHDDADVDLTLERVDEAMRVFSG